MVQLYNEDCLSGLAKIPDGSIDFVCTDPPFAMTDSRWDKQLDWTAMWAELKRVLAPNASVALFTAGKFSFELYATNPEMYRYKWYWLKNAPTNFVNAHNRPMAAVEEILIFSDGVIAHAGKSVRRMKYNPQGLTPYKPRERVNYSKKKTACTSLISEDAVYRIWNIPPELLNDKYIQALTGYPTDVLKFEVVPSFQKLHPNQKPVALLEYFVRTYTDAGETVLDFTMGSGSTGVACVNAGRNFVGFETDEKFYKIARERIDGALNDRASNLFAEVEA